MNGNNDCWAGAKDHEPLQAAEADAPVLGHDAAEVPGFREERPREARAGQRRARGSRQPGRYPGGGVREAGGEDRVSAGMFAEDGPSRVHLLRKETGECSLARLPRCTVNEQSSRGNVLDAMASASSVRVYS